MVLKRINQVVQGEKMQTVLFDLRRSLESAYILTCADIVHCVVNSSSPVLIDKAGTIWNDIIWP